MKISLWARTCNLGEQIHNLSLDMTKSRSPVHTNELGDNQMEIICSTAHATTQRRAPLLLSQGQCYLIEFSCILCHSGLRSEPVPAAAAIAPAEEAAALAAAAAEKFEARRRGLLRIRDSGPYALLSRKRKKR